MYNGLKFDGVAAGYFLLVIFGLNCSAPMEYIEMG
jgi:hypothetical protein